jgi:hypothetical protein
MIPLMPSPGSEDTTRTPQSIRRSASTSAVVRSMSLLPFENPGDRADELFPERPPTVTLRWEAGEDELRQQRPSMDNPNDPLLWLIAEALQQLGSKADPKAIAARIRRLQRGLPAAGRHQHQEPTRVRNR